MLLRGPESQPVRQLLHLCDPSLPFSEDGDEEEEDEAMRGGGGGGGQMPSFQLILASATLPLRVRHVITRRWPATQLLVSACAHRTPPNMKHEMRAVEGDKLVATLVVLVVVVVVVVAVAVVVAEGDKLVQLLQLQRCRLLRAYCMLTLRLTTTLRCSY